MRLCHLEYEQDFIQDVSDSSSQSQPRGREEDLVRVYELVAS